MPFLAGTVFTQVFVMGQQGGTYFGGPMNSTLTIVLKIYETSFTDFRIGAGQALAFVLTAIVVVVTTIQRKAFKRFDYDYCCSVAGYIFEKGRFRFRELCFTLILITMIIPFQSEMVPLFLLMSDLGLVDTHAAIVLPAMITPFAVFFFRQNVKSIPDDLLDAARIDGSGVLGRYWHVVVPNIKPAIGTITIFAFLGAWNNFLWPLIILNSRRKMLIEQVLSVLTAEFAQEPAARMAAATMAVVPILLVFFFSQRYFVRGIALTGLK